MGARGFRYASPVAANNDPAWSDPTAPASKTIATADVRCKHQLNVVGIWYGVEAEIQRRMITEHLSELREIQQRNSETLRAARAVISNAPPSSLSE
jgi:hypothetical protein